MPVRLPIDQDLRPPYRRREMLRKGHEAGWWTYESENPAGHAAGSVTYDEVTYTVKMPNGRRCTLLGAEVEGFVVREALDHDAGEAGPGGMGLIAYRAGLLPDTTE